MAVKYKLSNKEADSATFIRLADGRELTITTKKPATVSEDDFYGNKEAIDTLSHVLNIEVVEEGKGKKEATPPASDIPPAPPAADTTDSSIPGDTTGGSEPSVDSKEAN